VDVNVWDRGTIDGYHTSGYWDSTTLAERVAAHARSHADALAFVDDDSELTWSGYEQSSAQLGFLLSRVQALHAPVAVMFDDSAAVHVAYLAGERAGNVVVGIGARSGIKELAHILKTTRTLVIVTGSTVLGTDAREIVTQASRLMGQRLRHVVVSSVTPLELTIDGDPIVAPEIAASRLALDGRALGPDDLFFINSTSGTTGRPKCVMHTQNRWKYFHSRADHFRDDDVFMVVVPSPFGFGLWMAHFSPTMLGATTVVTKRFDVARTIEVAASRRVTVLAAVSSQVVMLEAALHDSPGSLSGLRVAQTGGERVPFENAAAFEDATGARVLQFYGSNEAGCVSGTTMDDPRDKRLGTAGRPLPEMHVRVFDEDGTDVTATGGPGQCGCRGPAIGPGYFDSPDAMKELFRDDGWLLLGDLVQIDEEGYLSVIGRTADFVVRGGHNVSAPDLEEEINRHPRVAISAVVGVTDPRLGERVCAFAVTDDGNPLSLDELLLFLDREMVTKASWPEALVVVAELPTGPGGKIGKAALRANAEELRDAGRLDFQTTTATAER
jgi:acyl-CoA synthetase